MNMNVLSHRDLGEIMAGYFTVPQNPVVAGLSGLGGCPGNGRARLTGMGQVCADGTQPVSGANIDPASSGVITLGCDDGSTPTCPAGYSLSTGSGQYSCTNNALATATGGPPVTSTTPVASPTINIGGSSIGQSQLNTYLMMGAGLLALVIFMGRK